ncbi:uncharacterized protein LOC143919744 [Arctopsyche grandis]|uniref:uncharacterized protein LOC143919744 n=1 Tax=Arctopsyche grandis TaxID=121162 RepID=UPI00406D7C81
MNNINNNAFEIAPSPRNKRKRSLDCANVFMNPALDLLATEDVICNTTMEIAPAKRSRRSRSCDERVAFENPALDLGMQKKDIRTLLWKELKNVNEKLPPINEVLSPTSKLQNSLNDFSLEEKPVRCVQSPAHQNSTPVFQSNFPLRRSVSFDLSFIEKLDVDDASEALYLDDDLNESNIMEIKTITTISFKKPNIVKKNTNPFLSDDYEENIEAVDNVEQLNNFPFDLPIPEQEINMCNDDDVKCETIESIYDATSDVADTISQTSTDNVILPRRLFTDDTCDTISQCTVEPSFSSQIHNIHHSTFKEKVNPAVSSANFKLNKQSKILGCDVSHITKNEIFDNNNKVPMKENVPNNRPILYVKASKSNKSSNIFSKIKDVFKHEKKHKDIVVPSNPYEVVRPMRPVIEEKKVVTGFENPGLNLNSVDADLDEMDEESRQCQNFQPRNPYEITPMKKVNYCDGRDCVQSQNNINEFDQQSAMKKHVRFDTTLNHEKVITGSSFDSDTCHSNSSSSHCTYNSADVTFNRIDNEIDEYHNELENCFNERKLISQNI